METVQALMGALFNAALVIMIVATMFSAGLSTTLSALGKVFKNVWLLVLTLIVAFALRPLVGWGLAAVFALATPIYISMLLLAACQMPAKGTPVFVDSQKFSVPQVTFQGGAGFVGETVTGKM